MPTYVRSPPSNINSYIKPNNVYVAWRPDKIKFQIRCSDGIKRWSYGYRCPMLHGQDWIREGITHD